MTNQPIDSTKPDIKDTDVFQCITITIDGERVCSVDRNIKLSVDTDLPSASVAQCYISIGGYNVPFLMDPNRKDFNSFDKAHLIWDNGYGMKIIRDVSGDDSLRTLSNDYFLIRIRVFAQKGTYQEQAPHASITGDRKYLNATGHQPFPGWIISQDITDKDMKHITKPDGFDEATSIVGLYLVKAGAVMSLNPYSDLYYPGLNSSIMTTSSLMSIFPFAKSEVEVAAELEGLEPKLNIALQNETNITQVDSWTHAASPVILVNKQEEESGAGVKAKERINTTGDIFGDMSFFARIIGGGDEVEILSFPERIIGGGNPQIPMPVISRYLLPKV